MEKEIEELNHLYNNDSVLHNDKFINMLESIEEVNNNQETLEFSEVKVTNIKDEGLSSSEDDFVEVNERDNHLKEQNKLEKKNENCFETMEIQNLFEKFKQEHLDQAEQLEIERNISSQKKKLLDKLRLSEKNNDTVVKNLMEDVANIQKNIQNNVQ